MDMAENDSDEIRRLRRTMRDLVALSTLSTVWASLEPEGIAKSLANVLYKYSWSRPSLYPACPTG